MKKGTELTNFLQAARWGSGMLASTFLISPGPNPVTVLLCFGLVNWGPIGPLKSDSGALVEGRRSRGLPVELEAAAEVAVAILRISIALKLVLLNECPWESGDGGVAGRWDERGRDGDDVLGGCDGGT